jgi:hypothetical protein
MIYRTTLIFVLTLSIFVMRPQAAIAQRLPPLFRITQLDLNLLYQCLERIHEKCGRFPTSAEGLASILTRPMGFACPTNREDRWECPTWRKDKDGWGEPLKYISDGSSYKIFASHDYFVTDLSPLRGKSEHWENPTGGETMPPLNFGTWEDFYIYLILIVGTFAFTFVLARRKIVALGQGQTRPDFRQWCVTILTYGAVFIFFSLLISQCTMVG